MAKFNDLYEAVREHDFARVRHLVQRGIDIDCRDSMRRTVLHHAARNFHGYSIKVLVETLVDLGADINARDIERKTPLHYAVSEVACGNVVGKALSLWNEHPMLMALYFGTNRVQKTEETLSEFAKNMQTTAVEFLVGLGADINTQCDHKVTSLHRAIDQSNIHGIETLLRLGVDVNAKKRLNCTALHLALETPYGTDGLLKHLVQLGADVNLGFTELPPLLQAVQLGRMDIIKLLVQNLADTVIYRRDNITPVMYSVLQTEPAEVKCLAKLKADLNAKCCDSYTVNEVVEVGREDILNYLVGHKADIMWTGFRHLTALGMALNDNLNEMVECLVTCGADINVRYTQGTSSPLATAMRLGKANMVKALARHEPMLVNAGIVRENDTALNITAQHGNHKTMELLIRYGGDVNLKYDPFMTPVHYAVAQRNGQMVQLLAELGANMNVQNFERMSLIHLLLESDKPGNNDMVMIKLLAEAGLDINQGSKSVTPLHDAVRLGDLEMVQILGESGANMNATRLEGYTPLFSAIFKGRTDVIRCFAENGLDVNKRNETYNIRPLHDAVCLGSVDMVRILIQLGASLNSTKHINTVLQCAVTTGNNEMVKCLLDCGADVNSYGTGNITPLHDAVKYSDQAMIRALLPDYLKNVTRVDMIDQVMPLDESILHSQSDITEILLKNGADLNCPQSIRITPLDLALNEGKVECARMVLDVEEYRSTIGSSPLHTACEHGHIDLARLLIIEGSNVNKCDHYRKTPLEYLPLANDADYHVLHEAVAAAKVTEQVLPSFVSTKDCQDMVTLLHTPGIGDVRFISSPSGTEISERVNELLESRIQQCTCQAFSEGKLEPIGSGAEGTRVGLPNEMDFLFDVQLPKDEERKICDFGNGYIKYDYEIEYLVKNTQALNVRGYILHQGFYKHMLGSAGFHLYFIEEVMNEVFFHLPNVASDQKVSVRPVNTLKLSDSDRKASSLLRLLWDDGNSMFHIPVDIVPCLHIDNWPEGATTRTWLMDEQELRSRGYVLVPKPPHVKSDMAKECTEEELRSLWKISFPHLETEHMQRLEQRVKDVYITAKCLRNPDVCRIMITDDGSLPRNVDKYVTSYLLKMCFFKNVDYFHQHDSLSLEEMVCRVYTELVAGLSKNFIPLFFLPKVSALSGIKLNVSKSVKVAKIMARFVRALYKRDCLGDSRDGSDDKNPSSVYKIYDISSDDF